MQKLSTVGLLVCLFAVVAACGDDDDFFVACTAESRVSVVITVVDAVGAPVPGAMVTYSVDGGAFQQATGCSSALIPACSGNVFVAGREVAGDFVMRVEKAGLQPATVSVRVARDECHVLTQQIVVPLVST